MAAGLTDHRWTMREWLSHPIPLPPWVYPPGMVYKLGRGRNRIASSDRRGARAPSRSRLCRPPGPAQGGRRPRPTRRRKPALPICLGRLRPTRSSQGPRPAPGCASRRRHVSIRDIVPPRGRGRGLRWRVPPRCGRPTEGARHARHLRRPDPRRHVPGRPARGRGPAPGAEPRRPREVGPGVGPPLVTRRPRPGRPPGRIATTGRGIGRRGRRACPGGRAGHAGAARDQRPDPARESTAGRPSGTVSTTSADDPRLGDHPDPGDIGVIWADEG